LLLVSSDVHGFSTYVVIGQYTLVFVIFYLPNYKVYTQ
jgi:hypothetical protein